jgi:circadian clock protein KaiC
MSILFPKVTSGITGLDEIIGGGFTKNNIITLSGGTGSGRTIFSTQFLVEGALKADEPGLYLSFDEPKFSIFSNLSGFNWNLPGLEREKKVVFIEYPHNELEQFEEQENSILELIDTLGVERIVFDSITPIVTMFEKDFRRRQLQKIVNIVRKWGATTIITAEDSLPPDPHMPRTNCGVEALTDGYIHLGWRLEDTKRIRTLEVMKLRGTPHKHDLHACQITNEGFEVLSKANKKTASKRSRKKV